MQQKKPTDFNVDYWLARACLLWTEGRLAEADIAWQKADAEANKLRQAGAYEFDRDRCARLRREIDLAIHPAAIQPPLPPPRRHDETPAERILAVQPPPAAGWPQAPATTIAS